MILSCALLLLAAGCKHNNEPVDPVAPVDPVVAPDTITGNLDAPAWEPSSAFDMTSSMTAVVRVDLSLTYPDQVAELGLTAPAEGDLVAVFDGEVCMAVSDCIDGLFYLCVAKGTDAGLTGELQFRYYSTGLRNIFVSSETVPFRNETRLGTYSDPYTPDFVLPD